MNKLFIIPVLICLVATTAFAQQEKRASPHDTVKGKNVEVTYGRPYKKGRDIFGGLVPYAEVWRTGADEATQITFKKDGTFGGKPIKAGTYTLFTIPTQKEWVIILNSKLGQWGAFGYEKAKDKNVLQAIVQSGKTEQAVEQFTITAKDDALLLEWDMTKVSVPMKF